MQEKIHNIQLFNYFIIIFVCSKQTNITNITNKSKTHIIRRKKWHMLQMFVVIFGTNETYKFINRTLVKENLLWYNLSIKGGFTMKKTLFEQFGGTYTKQGNYLLPNLILPAEEETGYIGVWGQRRLNYLKHHRKVLYCNLLTSGKLNSHLTDTEEQAQQLFSRLVKQYAEKEDVTEQLKATDQMKWVQKMNNIRSIATEIVLKEAIYI